MSTTKYDTLSSLKTGRYDYKIKVRIIRMWRASTKTGEPFKPFNIMIIDNKKTRMHAFIPGLAADFLEGKLRVGTICSITNFTVQKYKATDKFRCLRNENQLILSKDTKIQDLEERNTAIPEDMFDFYDHSELLELSKQTTYLADVVGIIKKHEKFRDLKNKHGNLQAKFTITDGSSNIKVTFWDKYGEKFEKAMLETLEKPVIIIISCCRVGLWNAEVDISNVAATKIYLNEYKHNSVVQLRKLLGNPDFAKKVLENTRSKPKQLLKIADVKRMGKECIEDEVLIHVKIKYIDTTKIWFFQECTSCEKETDMVNGNNFCGNCNRLVPYPETRFKLSLIASDDTGGIEINLQDREVRTITGKRARTVLKEEEGNYALPICIRNMAKKDYTIQLQIKEMNVVDHIEVYTATNICTGFIKPEDYNVHNHNYMQQSTSQATTSTYHLQGLSDLNVQSNQT